MKNKWRIERIAYQVNDKTRNGTAMLVIVTHKTSQIRPQYLIQTIKELLTLEWRLRLINDTFVLKSSFSNVLNVDDRYVNQTEFENFPISLLSPMYYEVYRAVKYRGNIHVITKLHLCEQVEINSSEFILDIQETYIFLIKTQQFLFDAEFLLYSRNDGNDKHVRICIEDAGMFKMKNCSRKNATICCIHLLIQCVVLLIVLF
jgi:hypothetical protein